MRFWGLIRRRLQALFPSYRPERHYMRGPGPKWREHHGLGLNAKRVQSVCRSSRAPKGSSVE
jgi:hypothetical protein